MSKSAFKHQGENNVKLINQTRGSNPVDSFFSNVIQVDEGNGHLTSEPAEVVELFSLYFVIVGHSEIVLEKSKYKVNSPCPDCSHIHK